MAKSSGLIDHDLQPREPARLPNLPPVDAEPSGPKLPPVDQRQSTTDSRDNSEESHRRIASIPVARIDPSPHQPRVLFNDEELEALADNIRAIGLQSPIEVRVPTNGRYELISGERRLRATQLLGRTMIDAFVVDISDDDAFIRAGAENLARADLAPFEAAKYIKRMKDRGIAHNNSEIARLTGKTRVDIIRYMSYFDLPAKTLAILETNPCLIGTAAAKELAAFASDHPDLVDEAAAKIERGMHQNKAAQWIRSKLEKGPMVESRREFLFRDGTRLGIVSASSRKISVSLSDESMSPKVKDAIERLLAQIAESAGSDA